MIGYEFTMGLYSEFQNEPAKISIGFAAFILVLIATIIFVRRSQI